MKTLEYTSFLYPNEGYVSIIGSDRSCDAFPSISRNRCFLRLSHFPWVRSLGQIDLMSIEPGVFYPPTAVTSETSRKIPCFHVALGITAAMPVYNPAQVVGLRFSFHHTAKTYPIAGLGFMAGNDYALFCPFADQTLPRDFMKRVEIPEIVNISRDIDSKAIGDITPAHLMEYFYPMAQAS